MKPVDQSDIRSVGKAADNQLNNIVFLALSVVLVIAVAGLLGYFTGSRVLGGSFKPSYVPISPSTSVCFLLYCAALFCYVKMTLIRSSRWIYTAITLISALFGFLSFLKVIIGKTLNLEDILLPATDVIDKIPIWRMSPVAGLAIAIFGIGVLLLPQREKPVCNDKSYGLFSSILGSITSLIGATVLLAYMYGTPIMYGGTEVPMALTASIGFLLLGIALVLVVGPTGCLMRRLTGDSTSAILSRAFTPLIPIAIILQSFLSRKILTHWFINEALIQAVLVILYGTVAIFLVGTLSRSVGSKIDEIGGKLRLALKRVEESDEHHRSILQTAMDGIWLTDMDGHLLEVNDAYSQMSGYSIPELLAMSISDLADVSIDQPSERIQKIKDEGSLRFETKHSRKDGSIIDVEISAQYRPADGGQLVVFLRDITEHNKEEKSKERAHIFIETLLEASPSGVVTFEGRSGNCTHVNQTFADMIGGTKDKILQKNLRSLPSLREAGITNIAEDTLSDGVTRQLDSWYTSTFGKSFFMEVLVSRFDIENEPYVLMVASDISIRKLLESYLTMGQDILLALSETNTLHDAVKQTVSILKSVTKVDAVGIRLQDGEDFPYFHQEGLSEDFLLKEHSLLARTKDGGVCRDENGNVCMECTCGLVITGNTDPTNPLFTKGGSAWTNDSFPFLKIPASEDPRSNPRNECIHQGYASIALVPIRAKGRVVGLIQLNVRAQGFFTLEQVELFERIAENVGEALLRKQTEEKLQLTRVSIEHSADAIYWMTPDARIVDVNEAACRSLGYSRDELLKLTIPDIDPFYNEEVWRQHFIDLRQQVSIKLETVHTNKSGEQFPVEVVANYVQFGKEELNCAITRNIADRKQIELYREMGRAVLQLLYESDGLEGLMPNLITLLKSKTGFDAVGIRLQDGDDFPYYAEEGFPSDWLMKENSLIAHTTDGSICRDENGHTCLECTCGLVITGKIERGNPFFTPWGSFWTNDSAPLLDLPPDADPRLHPRNECFHQNYASAALIPIRTKERIIGLLQFNDHRKNRFTPDSIEILEGIASHIGSALMRKKIEDEKSNIESQLHQAQKMESIGTLAGGVAHDFNNKLSVILGYTYLALTETDQAKLHEDLEEIRMAAEQSADLTRHLLAFARKQTIAPKVIDLNETISGMLKMLQRLIGENIHLTWHPAPDIWLLKLDPSQIDQILANLCVNARDAIKDGGKITIETGSSCIDADYCAHHADALPGDYVRLAVSDNGCGMENETRSRIFEPFFTTKETGKGTGLGLATVFGIVKQNGGFLNVYSEPGIGTTFTIYFPRHAGKTEVASKEGMASPPLGSETILLVEDELAILNMASTILSRQGYTILSANTPAEAIRVASENANDISLLITDVIMPEMNGKELAHKLLSLNSQLKCLYMSGYTADAISQHGVLDDGMHFIQKPFTVPDLTNKVRDLLDNKSGEAL